MKKQNGYHIQKGGIKCNIMTSVILCSLIALKSVQVILTLTVNLESNYIK